MAAGQEFCSDDWLKLKKRHKLLNEEDLLRYCFSSAYIVALLHDSLGIGLDDQRYTAYLMLVTISWCFLQLHNSFVISITAATQVQNIPLDWALGAFILQSTAAIESEPEQGDWIAAIFACESPSMILLIVISIVLFIAWYVSKWRKPELKTIYDLEKGRYIVTRVSKCW